jgi:hypothetical protein
MDLGGIQLGKKIHALVVAGLLGTVTVMAAGI